MQCVAMTRRKTQCKNDAEEGQLVCSSHKGRVNRAKPGSLEPATREAVIEEIKAGAPPLSAGAAVGIGSEDMQMLLDGDEEFAREVENAVLALQARNFKSIAAAAKSDWRAAVWLQDRMGEPVGHRPRTGRPQPVPGGGATEGRIPAADEPDPDYTDDQMGPDGKPL